jgi:two-component system phosphate regulon sensor histidine kinase PhoR
VKKTFSIITVLITISLIGIIMIQLSWLRNMILLTEEQIKGNVDKAIISVGEELLQYKSNYNVNTRRLDSDALLPDDFSLEFVQPITLGKRFSGAELYEKIRIAFGAVGLDDVRFEFALTTINPRTGGRDVIERKSPGFLEEYDDTVSNYMRAFPLRPLGGSAAENLAPDENLVVVALDVKKSAVASLRWRIAIAILFSIIIVAAFYLTVRTMLRQKKLGEIKNDFINNMTHEFKTPIATISLAVDAMRNEKVLQDRDKISYFSSIIKEENQRMNRQVETILKASQLERQEVNLNLQPLHLHNIIEDVVENFQLQLEEKGGHADMKLEASNDLVSADEVHMSNLVNNLIDNAVKYSKENVPIEISISTSSDSRSFYLRVEDNGIGMSKETLKRVFERFYRAHTGNLHNVKGFGLGLSYVKTIVQAHGGDVRVDSTLGKGSVFTLEMPLRREG